MAPIVHIRISFQSIQMHTVQNFASFFFQSSNLDDKIRLFLWQAILRVDSKSSYL